MNKKIAMSGLSIMAALTVLAGATYAAFSSSATATANTFATGNAELQIAQDAGGSADTFGSTISGPNFSGILPGQTKTFTFWLKNNSSAALNLDVTGDVSSIAGNQALDNTLLVSWICDTNGDNSLSGETPTGAFSPRAWLNGGEASLFLNLPVGQPRVCQMTGQLPSSADNTVAGQTVQFDAIYNATQSASL